MFEELLAGLIVDIGHFWNNAVNEGCGQNTLSKRWAKKSDAEKRSFGVGHGSQRNWKALPSPLPRPSLGMMSTGSLTKSFSPRLLKLMRRAAREGKGRIRRSMR
jgi:hypothetical protein